MPNPPRLPPPSGFFAALLSLLEHPLTTTLSLCVLGAAVVFLPDALSGPWAQIALSFAGFALLARALRTGGLLAAGCFVGGLVVAAVGAGVAHRAPGTLSLAAGPVESYEQAGDRPLSTHLGAALQRLPGTDKAQAELRLAIKDRELGRGTLPVDGSAAALVGPWLLKALDRGPAGEGTHVRLRVTPRAGGAPVPVRLAVGEGATVGDVRVDLLRIEGDFGRALGPAARLSLKWQSAAGPAESIDWHFVEAAELDARLGTAPVAVVVEAVEAEAPLRLAVARAGVPGVLPTGLGLMLIGLLLTVRRSKAGVA